MLGVKETCKHQGICEVNTSKYVKMKGKITKENEKTTRNQTTSQKSHHMDEYLRCPCRKILGTILKMDERPPTNGMEGKKTHAHE